MLASLLDPRIHMPRRRSFWLVLGALAAGQMLALWLLCSHQVRKAEARRTEHQVQQMALADCLRYIPGATIATCNSRTALAFAPAPAAAVNPNAIPATPVGFSLR